MGVFSWLDCEDNSQILIGDSLPCYVLIPKEFGGGHICEFNYDGYGHFGCYDIYDLVFEWNRNYLQNFFDNLDTWECGFSDNELKALEKASKEKVKVSFDWEDYEYDFDGIEKRELGIVLACYDEDNSRLKYPIKITHNPKATYEDCGFSASDEYQGCEYTGDLNYVVTYGNDFDGAHEDFESKEEAIQFYKDVMSSLKHDNGFYCRAFYTEWGDPKYEGHFDGYDLKDEDGNPCYYAEWMNEI